MSIPVFRPTIKRREMDAVLTCMVSDRIGPDQQARELVKLGCDAVGARDGLAFREYHRALEAALKLLNLPQGSAVLLSALLPGFYGTLIEGLGLVPYLIDVKPETAQIDVEMLGQVLDSWSGDLAPGALVIPSTLGFSADLSGLKSRGIPLIEDISEGFGTEAAAGPVGSFGDLVVMAMEMEHLITSGGGTLLLVRTKELASALDAYRESCDPYLFLPDMNAALGIVQMKEVEEHLEKRRQIAQIYNRALMKTRHTTFIQSQGETNCYSFPVLIEQGLAEVQRYALKHGVETRTAFTESLVSRRDNPHQHWPAAASLMSRCLLFPLYPTLGSKNISLVEKVISTLP